MAHISSRLQGLFNRLSSYSKHITVPRLSPDISGVRVLFLCNKENGLSKTVRLSLEAKGVQVFTQEVNHEMEMIQAAKAVTHDLIICPFLTRRVPKEVWENRSSRCLIVHPGIVGDRGMSSLDWAIMQKKKTWGVTVIEANQVMDTGDIWSTEEFPVEDNFTKSELYNTEVTAAAVDATINAVERFVLKIPPCPLDYLDPHVKGVHNRNMKFKDREIDWCLPAEDIVSKIKMSDSQPGCKAQLRNLGTSAILFGGHLQPADYSDEISDVLHRGQTGDLVAQKDGAVLIKAGDGNGVWSTQMKEKRGKDYIKLPAVTKLGSVSQLPVVEHASWEEIQISRLKSEPRVATVYFNFYNGAMSTDQCRRLQHCIESVGQDPTVKVVMLLGAPSFFSNGIHLNMIEASADTVKESWENINAINDVIKSFVMLDDKITISALQSSAGAGGVMMAAAADICWAREGIVLTPTYKSMHLHGSEYWTYFLPKRVGHLVSQRLTDSTSSILSQTAQGIGLVDKVFGKTRQEFLSLLPSHIEQLLNSPVVEMIVDVKSNRPADWSQLLEHHRHIELEQMKKCFRSTEYNDARRRFVYH